MWPTHSELALEKLNLIKLLRNATDACEEAPTELWRKTALKELCLHVEAIWTYCEQGSEMVHG